MLDTMNVRAVDMLLVAIGLGLVIAAQGLYFQWKLKEKDKEIQDLKHEMATLRDLLIGPKNASPLTE